MFDVGFAEITLIAIVALLVVGPEKLPGLVRNIGYWLGRARVTMRDLKRELEAADLPKFEDNSVDFQKQTFAEMDKLVKEQISLDSPPSKVEQPNTAKAVNDD